MLKKRPRKGAAAKDRKATKEKLRKDQTGYRTKTLYYGTSLSSSMNGRLPCSLFTSKRHLIGCIGITSGLCIPGKIIRKMKTLYKSLEWAVIDKYVPSTSLSSRQKLKKDATYPAFCFSSLFGL